MYALVRFLKEDKFDIVHIKDVMNFNFEKYKLNPHRKYKVKWANGKIYEGVVTHTSVSQNILEKKLEQNGRRLYSVKGMVSNTETEDDDKESNKSKEPNKVSITKEAPLRPKTQSPKKVSITKELALRTKTQSPKKVSITKEPPLPTKSQSPKTYVFNNINSLEINKLNDDIFVLKKEIQSLSLENDNLRTLNYQLQNEVITKIENLTISTSTPSVTPVPLELLQVGTVCEDKVYIGFETYVDKAQFDYVIAHSKSGPAFVKQLAVAVYGTTTLIKSSVTGQACKNKKGAVAKPALDALKLSAIKEAYKFFLKRTGTSEFLIDIELAKVSIYIARKITDLARPKKDNEVNNKSKGGNDGDQLMPLREENAIIDETVFNQLISNKEDTSCALSPDKFLRMALVQNLLYRVSQEERKKN